jgi:DNA-binding LacI/PurR family transcriptional regulator
VTRRVGSQQVADLAGVSRTTVSMILNGSTGGTFPETTRQCVLDAAASLGYTPNSAARMLVRGHSETIGLVVGDTRLLTIDAFVPQLLLGISRVANRRNYRVLLETVDDRKRPAAYVDLVGSRRIDRLIILNPNVGDQELRALIDSDFPVVLVGSVRHPREVAVNFRTSQAVSGLLRHVAGFGHRRIGHIAMSRPGPIATNARLNAYRAALAELGLQAEAALLAHGDFSAESGYRAMEEILSRARPPFAIFAANDTLALGAVASAAAHGLRVPEDVAVAGFDDLHFAAYTQPPLTTVRVPGIEQGELAARHLFRLLRKEPRGDIPTIVETELVIRRSCGEGRDGIPGQG